MARLVIIEETRRSLNIPFFTLTPEEALEFGKAMNNSGIFSIVGEMTMSGRYQKIRNLFFVNEDVYNRWASSPEVTSINEKRSNYNTQHNISERILVYSIDYTQL